MTEKRRTEAHELRDRATDPRPGRISCRNCREFIWDVLGSDLAFPETWAERRGRVVWVDAITGIEATEPVGDLRLVETHTAIRLPLPRNRGRPRSRAASRQEIRGWARLVRSWLKHVEARRPIQSQRWAHLRRVLRELFYQLPPARPAVREIEHEDIHPDDLAAALQHYGARDKAELGRILEIRELLKAAQELEGARFRPVPGDRRKKISLDASVGDNKTITHELVPASQHDTTSRRPGEKRNRNRRVLRRQRTQERTRRLRELVRPIYGRRMGIIVAALVEAGTRGKNRARPVYDSGNVARVLSILTGDALTPQQIRPALDGKT